ncbi:exosporium protein C [Cohnella abietis]|uniref:Exosporium protein C n=1 Tax=Cohnella abietis TaxID=2507935 RepID=A0A3T1DDT3_9BACL|nr:exosporium protein C [Cohnella abietis]BBI36326.1 hypothetical protein KCTCHS21_57250 [Cohnella abietis]
MTTLLAYNATVVTPITDGVQINVPQTPAGVGIATVIVNVPNVVPRYVEIRATVGIRGDEGTGQYLFRLFRGTTEIYYSLLGAEAGFEKFYLNTIQKTDGNAAPGPHAYTLSIEKFTPDLSLTVIGPVEISASVYG